jgi:hypothetical protein
MKQIQIDQLQDIAEPERIRLSLEREKVAVERVKSWTTSVSIFIPLLISALMIAYNLRTLEERAKIDFELKAAEIVMSAESPTAAANKATVLVELFPERLSPRFQEVFQKMYGNLRN